MSPPSGRVLREVNGHIYALVRSFDGASEYLCECGQEMCVATMLLLDPNEFADILALPDALLVAPGHEPPEAAIIRQDRRYVVVRRARWRPVERASTTAIEVGDEINVEFDAE